MAQTHILTRSYKHALSLDLLVDIHTPLDDYASSLPVLIWYHGGGLLQDSRTNVAHHLKDGVARQCYILVSVDYRLAPQVPLDEIVADCTDALVWVSKHLNKTLEEAGKPQADISKIAVAGGSAGGYLSLLVALGCPASLKSYLKACLAVYPITDPLGSFFTTSHDLKIPYDEKQLEPFIDPNGKVMSGNDPDDVRGKMYFYMLKKANLATLLHLEDSTTRANRAFRVQEELKHRTLQASLPPIYMVHGDADRAVGVEQSRTVHNVLVARAAAQKARGLAQDRSVYDEVPGADHLFDKQLTEHLTDMYAFLKAAYTGRDVTRGKDGVAEGTFTRTSQADTFTQSSATPIAENSSDWDSETESDYSDDDDNAQHTADQHWQQSLQELGTLANLILLPYLGKYFGRQFAFWSWAKWVEWKYVGVHVDIDKKTNRITGAVVAGLPSFE